jgi:hypothetical protein
MTEAVGKITLERMSDMPEGARAKLDKAVEDAENTEDSNEG